MTARDYLAAIGLIIVASIGFCGLFAVLWALS